MTNLDSILKSRDITLPTKVHLVKAMVFPVVMYGCESWIIKKAECWRTDAFVLWCWRRLLRVPWTARRSNWSILKETSPEYSLEGLMLKLKFQYFGHLMRRTDSLEKLLMQWKIEGRSKGEDRGWDGWMASLTKLPWIWASSGSCDGQGILACCSPWGRKQSDMTEQLNWTDVCMYGDSFCYRVETNTTLQSNYTLTEINFKKLCLYYEASIKSQEDRVQTASSFSNTCR